MLYFWAVGFILGGLYSSYALFPVKDFSNISISSICLFGLCKYFLGTRASLIICTAFLWSSMWHLSPHTLGKTERIFVLVGNLDAFWGSRVLVVNQNLLIFPLKIKARYGDRISCRWLKDHSCRLLEKKRVRFVQSRRISLWFSQVNNYIEEKLASMNSKLAGWNRALFFADWSELDRQQIDSFKHLGILHLLVLSGLHIQILRSFIQYLILAIPWIFYVSGLSSPRVWSLAKVFSEGFCIVVMLVYIALIGGKISLIRAFLFYSIGVLIFRIFGSKHLFKLIALAWFIQTLILPGDSLTPGSLMSWLASLWLMSATYWSIKSKLLFYIFQQVGLMLIAFVVFGSASSIAWLANLFVAPFFVIILCWSLLGFFVDAYSFFSPLGLLAKIWFYTSEMSSRVPMIIAPREWLELAHLGLYSFMLLGFLWLGLFELSFKSKGGLYGSSKSVDC